MTDEEKKEYQKQYYLKNKETYKEYQRQYRETHKEYFQQYRDNHKEERKEYNKKYRDNHKEERKEYQRQYRETHKKCCVYLYKNKNTNEIVYIGSTNNINRRISKRKHFTCCQFDKLYKENPNNYELNIIQETETRKQAYELEKELIFKYKPKYNVYNKS